MENYLEKQEEKNNILVNKFVKNFDVGFERSLQEQQSEIIKQVSFARPKGASVEETEQRMQEQNLGKLAIDSTLRNERARENQNRRERQEVADESKKQREKVNASEHQVL